jgi:hypothetical protein
MDEDRLRAFLDIGQALQKIADDFHEQVQLNKALFAKKYPSRGEVRDVQVDHPQTEEERLRESQGASDEDDKAWIGRREAGFVAKEASKARRKEERRDASSRRHSSPAQRRP